MEFSYTYVFALRYSIADFFRIPTIASIIPS